MPDRLLEKLLTSDVRSQKHLVIAAIALLLASAYALIVILIAVQALLMRLLNFSQVEMFGVKLVRSEKRAIVLPDEAKTFSHYRALLVALIAPTSALIIVFLFL